METSTIFIIIFLITLILINSFIVFIVFQSGSKRRLENEEIQKELKNILASITVLTVLKRQNDSIFVNLENIMKTIDSLNQEQLALIQENFARQNAVLNEINERVDYLSTEVNID